MIRPHYGPSIRLIIFSVLYAAAEAVTKEGSGQYYGSYIGSISNQEKGISGQFYCIDESTVYLRNFTYTGTGSVNIFVYAGTLGSDGGYTKTGYPLRNVKGTIQKLKRSNQVQNHVLKFPEDKTLFDINWLGIIDRQNKALYSRVIFDDKAKASIPQPLSLPVPLLGRNGLESSEVVLLDSRTILIKNLSFKGRAPNTHFMIGVAGTIPNDIDGFIIPDQRGSMEPLGPYQNQTIILSVPVDQPDLRSAKWFSIWSEKIKISLAHTLFPSPLNIPPSLDTIGVEAESTLNCETLDENLGLELRWTVSGADVILQLVSHTGSDRYLALGIRDPQESKGIAGDVVVGWISSKTGKGGVDDYFLAGKRIRCEDGAESCPDKSKGGTIDVELLNAVSRANYTMLTFRRSLMSKPNDLDVDIHLDQDQFLFWSVGYKSAAKRKLYKPLKNQEPIQVRFGRRPQWNCLQRTQTLPPSASPKVEEDTNLDREINQPRRRIASVLTPAAEATLPQTTDHRVFRRPTKTRHSLRQPEKRKSAGSQNLPKLGISHDYWRVPDIGCSESGNQPLYVHLGPATPGHGNQGVGRDGTAFYINGLLTPKLTLIRGQEYTFVVETGLGSEPHNQIFHPFYITDDEAGGRHVKTEAQARQEKVYAGVTLDRSGSIVPSAMGKLCRWSSPRAAVTYASYIDFHRSLVLECEDEPASLMSNLLRSSSINNPKILTFVPDNTMPDTLYYQSFMAKHLGGVIHLTDYCFDSQSVPKEVVTYRPNIMEHLTAVSKAKKSELLNRAESRRKEYYNNRRIDYDDDAYDYDYNDFDNEMDMSTKCQRQAKNLQDMPRFEHFPLRDIGKATGIDGDMPTEAQCRQHFRSQEQKEKEQVFQSLLNPQMTITRRPSFPSKTAASEFGGRVNPNQKRMEIRTPTTRRPLRKQPTVIGPILSSTTVKPRRASPTSLLYSTTMKPAMKRPTISTDRNTAKPPEFSSFQLDPSLLHNGFLFDRRQMEQQIRQKNQRPITTSRPVIGSSPTPSYSQHHSMPYPKVTFKPKVTSTTTMPTLPPPGGDVPAYMSYVNEAKAQYEATKKQNESPLISPPILKKIPIPMPSVPKKPPLSAAEKNFSMLPGLFLPNWFQDSSKKEDRIGQHKVTTYKETPPVASTVPRLPPPKNFPSFQKAQGKRPKEDSNRRRPQQPLVERRRRPGPPPQRPPKRPQHHQYAEFVRREMVETKPPLQLIPRRSQPPPEELPPEFQKKIYYPKRHLKLPTSGGPHSKKDKRKTVPSVEAGNATTSEISMADLQKFISGEELSEEESKLLQKLTEEPTSVSADLMPIRSSLQPFAGPLNPIIPLAPSSSANIEHKNPEPISIIAKEKKVPNTFVSLGFDPTALEPESGFKPITEGQGSSIPTLAFSVLDGADRPPVSPGLYQADERVRGQQQNSFNSPATTASSHPKVIKESISRSSIPISADFHSFADTLDSDNDYQYDVGFVETDRIDVQPTRQANMDPSAIVYSQQAAPYGEQFPSYYPKTIETRVGSADSLSKTLVAGDSVVYGKMPSGISNADTPSSSSSEYYDEYYDEFYYDDIYDETVEYQQQQLNSRLGIAAESSSLKHANQDKPMSFFQLLSNLNGSSHSS